MKTLSPCRLPPPTLSTAVSASLANFACQTVIFLVHCPLGMPAAASVASPRPPFHPKKMLEDCTILVQSKPFKCNTCEPAPICCRQRTYEIPKSFSCNTYKKLGEGSLVILLSAPNENHRSMGSPGRAEIRPRSKLGSKRAGNRVSPVLARKSGSGIYSGWMRNASVCPGRQRPCPRRPAVRSPDSDSNLGWPSPGDLVVPPRTHHHRLRGYLAALLMGPRESHPLE